MTNLQIKFWSIPIHGQLYHYWQYEYLDFLNNLDIDIEMPWWTFTIINI